MTVPSGSNLTLSLPPYHALTVVASADGSGSAVRLAASMGNQAQSVTPLAAGSTTVLGPYATPERFDIVCSAGSLVPSMAPVDFPTLAEVEAAAQAISDIGEAAAIADAAIDATTKADAAEAAAIAQAAIDAAAADFAIIGTIGTLAEVIAAGVPAASAQAALTVNPAGDDNGLTFTAVAFGAAGNAISIEYVDPAANDAALSVGVVGSAITVNLATGVAGAITSTAAQVLAAIEASGPAAALVTVAIDTADTGIADDGSGVVTAMALDNLAGGTGVGVGTAGKGSRYTDITNGTLYINTGDDTEPVWSQLAPV